MDSRVINLVHSVLMEMKAELDEIRAESVEWGKHLEWPWNGFILSWATYGGSKNWPSRIQPLYNAEYSWEALSSVDEQTRLNRFSVLGNPRYRSKVAIWAPMVFDRLANPGGPVAARSHYFSLTTARERIAYVMSFSGFGEKYGRNIPMDIYDDLVRDNFALDHRLRTFLAACGYRDVTYARGEELLGELAAELSTDAWTLDRVIYGKLDLLMGRLARISIDRSAA